MKYILVDGDIIVYRAGFATNDEPLSHALHAVKMMIQNLHYKATFRCHDLESYAFFLYLSADDKSNFRYDVAKTKPYKGNRKQDKPVHYHDIREYLIKHHEAKVISGIEADDAMGIENCRDIATRTIVTIDKDLDMIPGYHYNFVKDKGYYISRRIAYENFCIQMLTGDSVDNIRGYEGIGPVKAGKIIRSCRRDKAKMIQTVYDLYTTKYDEDYFMEMGNLLWIMRQEDRKWDPDLAELRQNRSEAHARDVLTALKNSNS